MCNDGCNVLFCSVSYSCSVMCIQCFLCMYAIGPLKIQLHSIANVISRMARGEKINNKKKQSQVCECNLSVEPVSSVTGSQAKKTPAAAL